MSEETLTATLRRFGWECGPDFWKRYYSDPWVFHLANAVEHLVGQVADTEERYNEMALHYIEASNPGIDMDEVRRLRGETL